MTKAELYEQVDKFCVDNNIDRSKYPHDSSKISGQLGIKIELINFKTPGLRGVACAKQGATFLHYYLNRQQRNFFGCHELHHHKHHQGEGMNLFQCFEAPPETNSFIEWQANEGAAELLVPYKVLLPIIKRNVKRIKNHTHLYAFRKDLARKFNVPDATIRYRLDSLKYEISQYLNGTSINNLNILSSNQLPYLGMDVESLNKMFGDEPQNEPDRDLWKGIVFDC